MQCPRCGWQNPASITACQRCGLAVQPAPPPSSDTPRPGSGQPGGYDDPSGGYGPVDPQQGGAQQGGYQQGGYGQQAGHPEGQQYGQQYGQPGSQYAQTPAYPPYQPYGQQAPAPYAHPYAGGSPYSTGPVAPLGATWPSAAEKAATSGRLARVLLVLGAVACVVYALWAMTARRGIFDDFVNNRTVTIGDARTSDRVDTTLLVIAGALAVIAMALWLVRLMAGRSSAGRLTVAGFAVSGLGMVCVVVGLVLSGTVSSGGDRAAEGRRALTATVVTGSGFLALAVGLLIGLVAVNSRRGQDEERQHATPMSDW